MRRLLHVLMPVFLMFSLLPLKAQKKEGNVFKKGTDEYKMFMARQDFFGGDYRSALNKYKEVEKNRPNDASVHFFIGECLYMMKEYEDAVTSLEKSKSISSTAHEDLLLVLGRSYHARGMVDKALESLAAYRATISGSQKKISESEVDLLISQCNIAKEMMKKPVNVKIIQLIDLNSQYDDKKPVLANGDKTLVFTSRRPMGDKSQVDKEGDYGYKEDVYESYWNEERRNWSQAEMMRGPINTPEYDACTSISFDGNYMFIYRNGGEARGGEIMMSKKSTAGKWKSPEILLKPINTSYFEDGACLSPDGQTLYFVSERPGGLGRGGDIYMSKKTGDGWGEPVNMGAPVNSPYDEQNPVLTPDGKTMFFASDRPESMGFHDIFRTTLGEDGKWTSPVNVGYPINSCALETKFVVTGDRKSGFIATVRDSGIGEQDIYLVDLSNYDVVAGKTIEAPKKAQLSGKITGAENLGISAEIRVLDKATGVLVTVSRSSSDGTYLFEFQYDKPVKIEVSAEGYQSGGFEIHLSPGKSETRDLALIKNN